MLERFIEGYGAVLDAARSTAANPTPEQADERRAVLEVMVATMLADGLVTEAEIDAIDRFGEDQGWDAPAFSFSQEWGQAVARARDRRSEPDGLDRLLAEADQRIATPEVRNVVASACTVLARADGATDEAESDWISKVRATFDDA